MGERAGSIWLFSMRSKRLAVLALLTALSMILSYIEGLLPAFVAIPGIKVGLANLAVVLALYRLGWREAVCVSLVRVLCLSLLFGNAAGFLYSIAGAVMSLIGMVVLKKTMRFSPLAVSVTGGVLHNMGQLLMACILLSAAALCYYLPFLLLGGILSGIVIGVMAAVLLKRIPNSI